MIEIALAVFIGCCIVAATVNSGFKSIAVTQDRQGRALREALEDMSKAARLWSAAHQRATLSDDELLEQLQAAKREKDKAFAAESLRKMRSDHARTLRSFES